MVPLLDVNGVVEALIMTGRLQGTGSLYCPHALKGLFHAHKSSGLGSPRRRNCQLLFLGGDFCSLGWAVMACQLLLAGLLVLAI